MIFSEEYDLSLFYMLKCDVLNRRKIKKFLKEMPIEAIMEIRKAIVEYSQQEDKSESIYGSYDVPNSDISYDYTINDISLSITKSKNFGEYSDDQFELMLCPIAKEKAKRMDEEWLGTATTKIKVISRYKNGSPMIHEDKENEYNLFDTKLGGFVIAGHNIFGDFCIPVVRPVSTKNTPDDINFEDIGISKKLSIGKKKS